jgi:adhesin transport system outer membrane protein
MVNAAKADLYPTIGLEGVARYGEDIDGFRGETKDLQGRVYLKWNVFDGGITRNTYQEMVRRASEARYKLLDVLDAQNSRYNVQVRLETARFSQMFAQYQTLAATNRFLTALRQEPGAGAGMNERGRFKYGPPKPAELEYRRVPR